MVDPAGRFGPYLLLAELGRGGMGVVHRARDERTGREVALKLVSRELSQDAVAAQRFAREARLAARVEHPNVVRVLEAGHHQGVAFLATELVEGASLARLVARRGPLPWREAVALAAQIARGLAAIHEAGLVHRDVKPDNVLVVDVPSGSARAKIIDLGLARARTGNGATLTRTGELLGTPEFMAPEQCDSAREADFRADLYAVGATLYALLVGRAPFQGSGYQLITKLLREVAPPPRTLVPDLPDAVDALVVRLLAKDPAMRAESATALADELEALAHAPEPRKSSRSLALVPGFVLLVGLGVGIGLRFRPAPVPPSPPPPGGTAAVSSERDPAVAPPGDPHAKMATGRLRIARTWGSAELAPGHVASGMALTPDGRSILSAHGGTGRVARWSRETGKAEWGLQLAHPVGPVAIAPDGHVVGVGANDGAVTLVDPRSGATQGRIDPVGKSLPVTALAFVGNDRILLGRRDDNLDPTRSYAGLPGGCVLARLDGAVEKEWPGARFSGVLALAVSPDGARAAWAESGGEDAPPGIVLADLPRGEHVLRVAAENVTALAFSPDGARLYAGQLGGALRVRDARTGAVLEELPAAAATVRSLATAGDAILVGLLDGTVLVHERAREPRFLAKVSSAVNALAVAGSFVVLGGDFEALHVLDLETGRERHPAPGHRGAITHVEVVPGKNGQPAGVLTAGTDGRVLLRDRDGTTRWVHASAPTEAYTALAVSPTGDRALAGRHDGTTELLSVATGEILAVAALRSDAAVTGCAFSKDGKRAFGADARGFLVEWDPSLAIVNRADANYRNVREIVVPWTPRAVVLFGTDDGIYAWQPPRDLAEPFETGDAAYRLARSPDGLWLGAWGRSTVRILEAVDARRVHGQATPTIGLAGVLAVGPARKLVALATPDGLLRLQDENAREVGAVSLAERSDRVRALRFTPDGKTLYAGTARGMLLELEVSPR